MASPQVPIGRTLDRNLEDWHCASRYSEGSQTKPLSSTPQKRLGPCSEYSMPRPMEPLA